MPDNRQNRKTLSWSRLDNAAKIFPPTSHGSDPGVFRLSCEFTEPVAPDVLQEALDRTLMQYPHLLMVMRRGVFWYYLEQTPLRPSVEPEQVAAVPRQLLAAQGQSGYVPCACGRGGGDRLF